MTGLFVGRMRPVSPFLVTRFRQESRRAAYVSATGFWVRRCATRACRGRGSRPVAGATFGVFTPRGIAIRPEQMLKIMGYPAGAPIRPAVRRMAERIAELAAAAMTPVVHHCRIAIERCDAEGLVLANGTAFHGPVFAKHLADCREAIAFIMTLGSRFDSTQKNLSDCRQSSRCGLSRNRRMGRDRGGDAPVHATGSQGLRCSTVSSSRAGWRRATSSASVIARLTGRSRSRSRSSRYSKESSFRSSCWRAAR